MSWTLKQIITNGRKAGGYIKDGAKSAKFDKVIDDKLVRIVSSEVGIWRKC